MCGILGSINLPFDDQALDDLQHRGPDGCGITDLHVAGHHVRLGHRRLAIVDLSAAGRQPMQTADQQRSIVYNGEVYNHAELRRRMAGVRFSGHSDTETVLHFIAQYGIGCLDELNGIFALGLVDAGEKKLFLARDPFGVKPLYYWSSGRSLVFSSEMRSILRLTQGELDPASLAELLRLRYLPSPDTLFKDIRKVRPGHIVEVSLSSGHPVLREYPYVKPSGSTEAISYDEALDRYGQLIESAVQRQLMSDVEVGVLLSGGIDSALIAGLAQKYLAYPMKAFTVGFTDDCDADEMEDARKTAASLGLEHHHTRIGFKDFLAAVRECTSIVEEPLATTSVIPMFHLARLASQQVKVVLSGQGADEPLGGYLRYQQELVRKWLPPGVAHAVGGLARTAGVRSQHILRGASALGERDDLQRFIAAASVFTDDEIQALIARRDTRSNGRLGYFYDLLRCAQRGETVARMMSLDMRTNLADDLLLYTDKVTMHHSLECRVPMLDRQLVGFLESLPVSYRVRLCRRKIIHKDFARKVLPLSIIKRKKKGFLSPTRGWFKDTGLLREILLDRTSRFANYFDLHEVDRVLTNHQAGHNRERHIFLLLGVHCWMEQMLAPPHAGGHAMEGIDVPSSAASVGLVGAGKQES